MTSKDLELLDNFSFFDTWEEKYSYIIELGAKLPPLDSQYNTEQYKVHGCMSQVWLHCTQDGNICVMNGTSDALIVKGLIAILHFLCDGVDIATVQQYNFEQIFTDIGLHSHLSPNRRNGFFAMTQRIQESI